MRAQGCQFPGGKRTYPDGIEALLAARLGFIPRRELCSDFLHRGAHSQPEMICGCRLVVARGMECTETMQMQTSDGGGEGKGYEVLRTSTRQGEKSLLDDKVR